MFGRIENVPGPDGLATNVIDGNPPGLATPAALSSVAAVAGVDLTEGGTLTINADFFYEATVANNEFATLLGQPGSDPVWNDDQAGIDAVGLTGRGFAYERHPITTGSWAAPILAD